MPSASTAKTECPGCGRPATPAHAPFCSQGCRDRDLLQWLSDGHRLPGPPVDLESPDLDRIGLEQSDP